MRLKKGDEVPEMVYAITPDTPLPPFGSMYPYDPERKVYLKTEWKNGKQVYVRDVHSCDYYDNVICKHKDCDCKNRRRACYQELESGQLKSLHKPCDKKEVTE